MNIIYAGTPAFAATILEGLMHSSHQVIAVFTQADKPAGRGLKLKASPVKTVALSYHLPTYQPLSLKEEQEQTCIKNLNADVMIVAAYGLMLPQAILSIPRFGCINIHPSLLPRFRGAAPIQRTILAGDHITGVSMMQMDPGLDTGPILLQRQYVLDDDETSETLHKALAELSVKTLLETLDLLAHNQIIPKAQDHQLASYAPKITKEEACLDWQQTATELDRMIRAFNPHPVAYTSWQGQNVRIFAAKVVAKDTTFAPRTIVHASCDGVDIATSKGVLRLLTVQLPGGKILPIADFYNAKHDLLKVGEKFL